MNEIKPMEIINTPYKLGLGISPNEGDIAIVPIDYAGTPGRLNLLVLEEYGYSVKDLPKKDQLTHGFSQISERGKKAILFVVTVNGGNTSENLEKNLYNTLIEFSDLFSGKRLWLPLMGTGDGKLPLQESYSITVRVVNRFQNKYPTETTIIFSIPDSSEGKELFNKIRKTDSIKDITNDAKEFLNTFKGKFYLVGSFWGSGNDQIDRFIKDSTWEKGHEDETYSSIINEVKKGDILIIKSTFQSKGTSYLKIKAFGIVSENILDGTTLSVDWKITGLWVDVENLGFYRNTIHEAYLNDIIIILSKVDKNLWKELNTTQIINQKKETIAGLISDSDKGIDYLDITKDVNAFAKVVAAKSFEPPLAIALFGKWGSGKSFFMRKLKEQITKLSSNKPDGIYCEGIAHIHFNAWSYMDSNLWASIVTKIYEGLNEYISENSETDEAKKEIEKHLTNQLSISKEEIEILENKKIAIVEQINSLQEKRETISEELVNKINEIKTNTIWKNLEYTEKEFNAKEKILSVLNDNDTYLNTVSDLKSIIPEKYWNNPEKTYQLINSKYTFLKEFFRKDKIQSNLIWFTSVLLIIAFIPILLDLCSVQIKRINFILPTSIGTIFYLVGAAWKRAGTVYNQLQPVIASFWKI